MLTQRPAPADLAYNDLAYNKVKKYLRRIDKGD